MIVRCGRCQAELEVSGPGEFSCPACGTRNAVRAPASTPGAGPLGVPDLGVSVPPPEPVELIWLRCSQCRRRFVVAEGLEKAPSPACGTEHDVTQAERG